ncbi:MAG: glycerophosphoryl diester phosphodiesterase membrane domain-containing protein [archaeon]
MLFSNLFTTLLQILTKPKFFIPMIIVILASGAVTLLSGWALERPVIDLVLYYDSIPQDNLLGVMLANYPLEIATILFFGLLMTFISLIGLFSIARLAKGEKLVDAVNDSVADWKKSAAVTIIFSLAFVIFAGAFSVALMLSAISDIVSQIVSVILTIILFIVIIKVVFVIPALTEKEVKKAFQESWKFTDKRFWKTTLLVILTSVIAFVGILLITQLGIVLGEVFEIPFSIIGEAFGTTYFIASITNYFYHKEK